MAAGLALIETIDVAVPGQALMLKWPNDLMLGGKKLGGILIERSGERVAVGFGVNLATAPKLANREAATLPARITPEAFAPLLAASVTRLVGLWRTSESSALARAWEHRGHVPGTKLTIHVATDETITGRFGGLEPDGALRLIVENGSIEVIRAGDVQL